jgi:predicted alpha/beta superfamily hydrolase
MMNVKLTVIIGLLMLVACQSQQKKTEAVSLKESKIIIHENFQSKYVDARNVEVFLPTGYNSESDVKYRVLYMHDGQNVFNPETSYTKIDWGVDEAIDSLMKTGVIQNTIVVAPWNTPKRFSEYMPKAPSGLSESPEIMEALKKNTGYDSLFSDDYLKFLVEELKPFIDKTYNTSKKIEHTSIMGSSMGGLISLYALCKYPEVFGAAGCVSTHWPVPRVG